MASEAVHDFIIAVNGSAELRKKTQAALEASSGPAAFVAVAKGAGYDFSEADAREYFAEVLAPQRPRELKDKELEQVSGGKDASLRPQSFLNDTVKMFQSMSFQGLPSWTGFRF
jgi:predicted ribosomally synthesized peptide with nif11-like leader